MYGRVSNLLRNQFSHETRVNVVNYRHAGQLFTQNKAKTWELLSLHGAATFRSGRHQPQMSQSPTTNVAITNHFVNYAIIRARVLEPNPKPSRTWRNISAKALSLLPPPDLKWALGAKYAAK